MRAPLSNRCKRIHLFIDTPLTCVRRNINAFCLFSYVLQVECEPTDNIHLHIAKLQPPHGSFDGVISLAPFPVAGLFPVTRIEVKSNAEPVGLDNLHHR